MIEQYTVIKYRFTLSDYIKSCEFLFVLLISRSHITRLEIIHKHIIKEIIFYIMSYQLAIDESSSNDAMVEGLLVILSQANLRYQQILIRMRLLA